MKFVFYGDDPLEDMPEFVIVHASDGARHVTKVSDGTGVTISPGAGLQVIDIFKLPTEEQFRYRIRKIFTWDKISLVELEFPSVESVPAETWAKAKELIAQPEKGAPVG